MSDLHKGRSIVGVWRLVDEVASDQNGQPIPTLFGPVPMGVVTFLSNGRMIVAIADGRPGQIEGRAYCSYCGNYSFDGTRLVTTVDDGSSEFWRRSPQIRAARFSGERMVLRPPIGLLGPDGAVRELTWERIAPSP
jgi:hypothetical protein